MQPTPSRRKRKRATPASAPCLRHAYNTRSTKRRLVTTPAVTTRPSRRARLDKLPSVVHRELEFTTPSRFEGASLNPIQEETPKRIIRQDVETLGDQREPQDETWLALHGPSDNIARVRPDGAQTDVIVANETTEDEENHKDHPNHSINNGYPKTQVRGIIVSMIALILGLILGQKFWWSSMKPLSSSTKVATVYPMCYNQSDGPLTYPVHTVKLGQCRAFPKGWRHVRTQGLVHRKMNITTAKYLSSSNWIILPSDVADEVESVVRLVDELQKASKPTDFSWFKALKWVFGSIVSCIVLFYATALLVFGSVIALAIISKLWEQYCPKWTIKCIL